MTFFSSFFPLGLSTEGIYRVSGNKAEMESMQRQFDQGVLLSTHSTHSCTFYRLTAGCKEKKAIKICLLLSITILTPFN